MNEDELIINIKTGCEHSVQKEIEESDLVDNHDQTGTQAIKILF